MNSPTLGTRQKALALNLDARTYGTIAEIGGGQEVARSFFKAGGAAGTVAKTISAYDMAISDGIYGPTKRYVSRERLNAMLDHEFAQVSEQLRQKHGDSKCFFAFANTVATRRFHSPEDGRGWIGIRFQPRPNEESSQITLHAHLHDSLADLEQEALGVLGVNLIYGAFFFHHRPPDFIASLMDDLSRERVEIDTIKFSGPAFPGIDNRLMSLQLVEHGFTDAAMFTADGEVVQPSEVLHDRPVLVERGRFRPVTKLTMDLLERAREAFLREPGMQRQEPVVLAEMTLRNLIPEPEVGHRDFLARADVLGALGFDVLISRFEQDYRVAEYLARYTDSLIGFAVGLPKLKRSVEERFYTELAGGALEAVGRLYNRSVKTYVYPARDRQSGQIETIDDMVLPSPWHHLRRLLRELGRVQPIHPSDEQWLSIDGEDVLARMQRDDPSWKAMVPPNIVAMIESEGLFRENLPTSHIVGADDSPNQDAVRPDRPVPWLTQ
jgi:hypothetical protein